MAEKDSLVSQSDSQVDNYRVTGSDFSKKSNVSKAVGNVDAPGDANKLVPQSDLQCSPRNAEGSGGDPDSMSARSSAVSANFKVSTNAGEGSGMPSPSLPESVNLSTGMISVKGASVTRKGETPDHDVHIG